MQSINSVDKFDLILNAFLKFVIWCYPSDSFWIDEDKINWLKPLCKLHGLLAAPLPSAQCPNDEVSGHKSTG